MDSAQPNGTTLRFADFELRPELGELRRGGIPLKLKPQPLRVLALLAANAGEPVTRQTLQGELWPGDTFVDFERGLNSCIAQVRAALNDTAEAPRYIETLHRRGYRFLAPVERTGPPPQSHGDAPPAAAPVHGAGRRGPRLSAWWGMGLVLLSLLAGVLYSVAVQAWTRPSTPAGRVKLAVLPFENLSGDAAQDYFSDGFSDDLTTMLGRRFAPRLGVIARTSVTPYRKSPKTAVEIARELDVQYIIEGSVRREGDRLRVSAKLVDARDHTQLWAESFQAPAREAMLIHGEVARRVGESLALSAAPPGAPASPPRTTRDWVAHDAYLRGREQLLQFHLPAFREAVRHFEDAIGRDPNYALAYASLADAYSLQPWWGGMTPRDAFARARPVAEKAIELDPAMAEGYVSRAFIRFYYNWDFDGAERDFRRAVELNPGLATAHYWYAGLLSTRGRHDEALASIRRAQELDPLSFLINADAGWYSFYARRYDAAIAQCRRALEIHPRFGFAQLCISESLAQAGRKAEAFEELKRLWEMTGAPKEFMASLAGLSPAEARQRMLQRRLQFLTEGRASPPYVSAYNRVMLHLSLGENDAVLEWLAAAIEDRDTGPLNLRVDPRFDALRKDPRFEQLLTRAGL